MLMTRSYRRDRIRLLTSCALFIIAVVTSVALESIEQEKQELMGKCNTLFKHTVYDARYINGVPYCKVTQNSYQKLREDLL